MSTSPRQLFLLADHLKLSLLERQRAISLNLPASRQDAQIKRSLETLHSGIVSLESQYHDAEDEDDNSTTSDLTRLRKQYTDLSSQFYGDNAPTSTLLQPNDPTLASDFTAATTLPPSTQRTKQARFRDNPITSATDASYYDDDAQDLATRNALFSTTTDPANEPYRDDPDDSAPDQSQLSNQQIHAHHSQVLRDQDSHLEALTASVGRQRMIGIAMGNELDEQNELLDDVEAGVDRHVSTLERAQKRLGVIARKSRANWSWVTIGILIVVLLLLIIVLK